MTHIQRFHDNLAFASRCSTTEHRNAYHSNLLARRLGHPRRRHAARGIAHDNRHDRMQLLLSAEAAMKCLIITYIAAAAGAAVGFLTAPVFQAGGPSFSLIIAKGSLPWVRPGPRLTAFAISSPPAKSGLRSPARCCPRWSRPSSIVWIRSETSRDRRPHDQPSRLGGNRCRLGASNTGDGPEAVRLCAGAGGRIEAGRRHQTRARESWSAEPNHNVWRRS